MMETNVKNNKVVISGHEMTNVHEKLKITVKWSITTLFIIGTFVLGIWTFLPTERLVSGIIRPNLLGYISNCPVAPFSTSVAFGTFIYSVKRMSTMAHRDTYGLIIFAGGLIGMSLDILIGLYIPYNFVASFFLNIKMFTFTKILIIIAGILAITNGDEVITRARSFKKNVLG